MHLGRTNLMILPLVIIAVMQPPRMHAQEGMNPSQGREPRFLLATSSRHEPVRIDVKRTPVLQRRLSLRLENVTLREALAEISRQARLHLVYADDILPVEARVALRVEGITTAAALEHVLTGANVDVVLAQDGRATLVRQPVLEPPQQFGSIAGVVTRADDDGPIPGVLVGVEGIRRTALTDATGSFRIDAVPAGTYRVRAAIIGFATVVRDAEVRANGVTTVNFALAVSPTQLAELVVTATGPQRRMELGNAIGRIAANEAVSTAPITNLADLINARVAGVQVLLDGGLSGGTSRIRVRGTNSLSVSNAPLITVDGIRVEGSRLNELNAEEIELIEIVKGASAATLYGTDAANGVIVVTTKRGRPGRTLWNVYAESGRIDLPSGTEFPANYFSWGRNLTTNAPQQCRLTGLAAGVCAVDSLTFINPLEESRLTPLRAGARQQFGIQASGGVDRFTFFVAAEHEYENGPLEMPRADQDRLALERGGSPLPDWQMRPNWLRKVSLRGNFGANLGRSADVRLSSGVILNEVSLPSPGFYSSALFGSGIRDEFDGWWAVTQRPAELFAAKSVQDARRYTNAVTVNWRSPGWLTMRATVGLDLVATINDQLQLRGQGPNSGRNGRRSTTQAETVHSSVDLGATAAYRLNPAVSLRTAAGAQYNRRSFQATTATATDLPPGSDRIAGAGTVTASESNAEAVVAGSYVEQQLGYRERLFLTGALRVDGGSSFGRDFKTAIYPKTSASWIAYDNTEGFVRTVRWRAAFGASGVQPGPTDALPLIQYFRVGVGNVSSSGARQSSLGNPDLRPERQTELESGIDIDLFRGRASLEATYYDRLSKDALIRRGLPPSVGGGNRLENIGSVRNRGFEWMVSVRVLDVPQVSLDFIANGSHNTNRLEEIGPDIPFIGSATYYRNVKGYPVFSRFDRPILGFSDANGNGIIEESEVQVGDTAVFLGPSSPTRQTTLESRVGLLQGRLHVSTQLDYRGGFTHFNSVEWSRCGAAFGNCRAVNDPAASLADQARAVAATSSVHGNTIAGYLEPVSFIRWREFSLAYQVPDRFISQLGARSATISLAGRNLALLGSSYTGVDPEVNAYPDQFSEGYSDIGGAPPSRYWIIRVNFGF